MSSSKSLCEQRFEIDNAVQRVLELRLKRFLRLKREQLGPEKVKVIKRSYNRKPKRKGKPIKNKVLEKMGISFLEDNENKTP